MSHEDCFQILEGQTGEFFSLEKWLHSEVKVFQMCLQAHIYSISSYH